MTKLDDLINSLATLLVRYHDSQPNVKKLIATAELPQLRKNSRKYAINLLQNQDKDFKTYMEVLIKKSTNGYSGRSGFLTFILHEIMFLKSLQNHNTSMHPNKLEQVTQKISQLCIDLRTLLTTTKNNTCNVQYSHLSDQHQQVSLVGLVNDNYLRAKNMCNSGYLLNEEVLGRLNIFTTTTDDEIVQIANSISTEHQNILLITTLQADYLSIKNKSEAQKTQHTFFSSKLQNEITQYKTTILQLEQTITKQSKKLAHCELKINQLDEYLSIKSELLSQNQTISNQADHSDMDDITLSTDKTMSPKQMRKLNSYDVSPSFFTPNQEQMDLITLPKYQNTWNSEDYINILTRE